MIEYLITRQFFLRITASIFFIAATYILPASTMASEPPIGRLFTSPRERATLDQERQAGKRSRIDTNTPATDQLGDQVTLDGFVQKNNGKTTVWINRVPQHGQENPQGITIVQSGHHSTVVSMQLPSGKNVSLKAGQKFDATNGKVTDVYDGLAKPGTKESAK